jgi:hypothetical protein
MKTSKLNSALNQQRSQNIGVEEYVWRTAGDERVRDSHKSENGKTFGWDDESKAKDYEFDYWYGNIANSLKPPIGPEIHPSVLRRWLERNRNRVLDHIGTKYDPEEAKAER